MHVYIIRRETSIYFSLTRSGFLLRQSSLTPAAGKWPYCCPLSSHVQLYDDFISDYCSTPEGAKG